MTENGCSNFIYYCIKKYSDTTEVQLHNLINLQNNVCYYEYEQSDVWLVIQLIILICQPSIIRVQLIPTLVYRTMQGAKSCN